MRLKSHTSNATDVPDQLTTLEDCGNNAGELTILGFSAKHESKLRCCYKYNVLRPAACLYGAALTRHIVDAWRNRKAAPKDTVARQERLSIELGAEASLKRLADACYVNVVYSLGLRHLDKS